MAVNHVELTQKRERERESDFQQAANSALDFKPDARCLSCRNARICHFYEHSAENFKGTGAELSSRSDNFLGPTSFAAPQNLRTGGFSSEIGGDFLHFLV